MSIIVQLPPGTQFYQPLARFTADFNSPLVGGYDWDVAANTDQNLMEIRKNHLYLVERYSFSATINEGVFLAAVLTVPTVGVRIPTESNRLIHPNPIPLVNYIDGLETMMYAYSDQDQYLTATFRGQLSQTADLVGISEVTAQVQFNIYEIKNGAWIENFLGRTHDGQARGLVMRGGRH